MTAVVGTDRCAQRGMGDRRCSMPLHHRGPHVYRHGDEQVLPMPARCRRCGARVFLRSRNGALGWYGPDGRRHDPCVKERRP